jgi:hypothetical protein
MMMMMMWTCWSCAWCYWCCRLVMCGAHDAIYELTAYRDPNLIPIKCFYEPDPKVRRWELVKLYKTSWDSTVNIFVRLMKPWNFNVFDILYVCVCVCGPRLITLLYWLLIEILQQEKNCTEPLLVGYVSLVKEKNMRADLFRKKFYKLLSKWFFAIYHQ